MTPIEFLRLVRRRWVVAVAVLAVCVAGAVAYAVTAPTTYAATSTLYVSMATGTSVNDSFQGGMAAQQRVTTYSHLAGGPVVAERVIDELGLDTTPGALASRVSVTFPPATALLEITATDPTPEGARLLADAFASQFGEMVGQMETTVVGAAPAAQATVIEPAERPTSPVGRPAMQILALGTVLGLVLGVLAAFVRDRLDQRVRRPEQLGDACSAPVLAVGAGEPEATRAYARLRRVVTGGAGRTSPTTLVVTSISGRSQPWVGLRLARSLDAAGTKAVLVDADTSAHGPSAVLGLLGVPGAADWLAGRTTRFEDVVRQTEDGCAFVPLGVTDDRTVELLDSERSTALLERLGEQYDHIVVAAAPADAATLAASWKCAGAVVVGEIGTTTVRAARDAAEAFAVADVPVVATVALAPVTRSARHANRRTGRSELEGGPS
ncbi:Wzz/FepE/Etk N-terminal domain-containing protein [Blastococcus sp. VKM Ac-2987]|uniref:Wzz/FepE/Etk N-terminal domain-containing protein n=1 Tax=Blastococcus sp. VKM Ac-2987 TaxID=3004141 RepID=UPI0022AB8BEA|nr:Wzz/FepE/Etk N-terminal domain-containing protein [Blastococcus sp. VKM Ac-2987]MCZ2858498.1 Wzz/FepE/Etk N-terminal domain-containing protein [Blastococcus sp. VKM Ac-2987]